MDEPPNHQVGPNKASLPQVSFAKLHNASLGDFSHLFVVHSHSLVALFAIEDDFFFFFTDFGGGLYLCAWPYCTV